MNMSESRLQGLFQYLHLLNEMDNGYNPYSSYNQKQAVCKEIEKELGVEWSNKRAVEVENTVMKTNTEEDKRIIADEIAKKLIKSAGTILR